MYRLRKDVSRSAERQCLPAAGEQKGLAGCKAFLMQKVYNTMYYIVQGYKMKNEPVILRLSYGYVAVIIW